MLQVPNAAAQLMAGSLLGRGVLCFKRRIRGDVLRHVFGPDERGKSREEVKHKTTLRNKKQIKGKTHSRIVRFFGMLPSWGCLPLSMALGFFPLRTGEKMRSDG
jgi:hypothetical protein